MMAGFVACCCRDDQAKQPRFLWSGNRLVFSLQSMEWKMPRFLWVPQELENYDIIIHHEVALFSWVADEKSTRNSRKPKIAREHDKWPHNLSSNFCCGNSRFSSTRSIDRKVAAFSLAGPQMKKKCQKLRKSTRNSRIIFQAEAFSSAAWKNREVTAFSMGSQYRLVPGDCFHACQVGILVLICTDKFY